MVTRLPAAALAVLLVSAGAAGAYDGVCSNDRTEAWPVTLVQGDGGANRIDFVFMGDGFDTADLDDGVWAAHMDAMIGWLSAREPYQSLAPYINWWRADVCSVQGSIGSSQGDTAFRMATGPKWDGGLLAKHKGLIRDSVPSRVESWALVANTFVAMGVAPGDTSVTGLTAAIVMHEFGHTFGGLADEYVTHYCSNICPGGRLSEPNVSCERMVDDSEWAHWAGAFNGAVPPSGSQNFEGAKYCISGRFRSMRSTVMGTYPHQTNDYGPVNRESLALAVFSSVDLIDGPTPAPGRIDAPSSCADLVFRPGVPPGQALGARGLDLQWSLDGVDHRHRSDGSWTMDRPCALPTGSYAVRLDAANNTDFVRKDPAGVTRQSFEWTVDVLNKPPAPVGTPPGWTTAETADPLALDASGWFSDPEDNDLEYSWTAVPAGIVTLASGSGGAASMTTAGPGSATVTAAPPRSRSASRCSRDRSRRRRRVTSPAGTGRCARRRRGRSRSRTRTRRRRCRSRRAPRRARRATRRRRRSMTTPT